MRAGDRDRRIRIERAVVTLDALGGEVKTWAELATVWASVRPLSDGERWRAEQVAATVTTRFGILWGLNVTVLDRIVYDGRVYEISAVKEIGFKAEQEITAAARTDE